MYFEVLRVAAGTAANSRVCEGITLSGSPLVGAVSQEHF